MSLPKLNTPTYELSLPSSGKNIKYRPFLVKEHKVLLTMSNADKEEVDRIVRELVQACTFNSVDADKSPHFDIEYIFMNLRAKSVGETVEVVVNCACGNKIDTMFNINDIKVESQPGHTNKIMLDENYGVEMKYPKFKDVLGIFESSDTSKIMDLVVECMKGIYDKENYWEVKEQSKEEIDEFVSSLTKQQFDKIENFFVTSPKVVQVIESDCPKCGKHNTSRLEGLSNFFV